MQESILSPSTWKQTVLGWLASFLVGGGIVKLYITWLNRNKPAAEVHVTQETASEIRVRASANAGDSIMRFMDRLDHAQSTIDRVRAERDAWEGQYNEVFTEKVQLKRENGRLSGEVKAYEAQIKRMQRTMADSGVNFDNTQDMPVGPTDS